MQYYLARDDGEVFGPYAGKEEALMWLASTTANDPDAREPYATDAGVLVRGWASAATLSKDSYDHWQNQVLDLAASLDWNIYGVDFVLGTDNELFGDRLHVEDPTNEDEYEVPQIQ